MKIKPHTTLKTLLASIALSLLAAPSHAEVLIYKGAIRASGDISSPFPRAVSLFEIVDVKNSRVGSILVFTLDGQKRQLVSPPSEFRFGQAPLKGGKTTSFISVVVGNGGANDFYEHTGIFMRGINASLKVTSSLGGTFVNYPRVFTGSSFQYEAFASAGAFIEQRFTMVYQTAPSIAANDANQSLQQALDALSLELKNRGFENP